MVDDLIIKSTCIYYCCIGGGNREFDLSLELNPRVRGTRFRCIERISMYLDPRLKYLGFNFPLSRSTSFKQVFKDERKFVARFTVDIFTLDFNVNGS